MRTIQIVDAAKQIKTDNVVAFEYNGKPRRILVEAITPTVITGEVLGHGHFKSFRLDRIQSKAINIE
jgi:hypothetical protein